MSDPLLFQTFENEGGNGKGGGQNSHFLSSESGRRTPMVPVTPSDVRPRQDDKTLTGHHIHTLPEGFYCRDLSLPNRSSGSLDARDSLVSSRR